MARKTALATAFIASLIVLTGCVSAEQLRQRDEATCTNYGFKRDTPEFATCLQRESLARRYWYGWGGAPAYGWYSGPGIYPRPPGALY